MSNHHPMKPPILVLFNLLAASRDCHGFGVSIPPRISPLSRHSLTGLDDLDEQNDFAAADLDILRAEIEEMGGDPSFLIDRGNPLINKPPKEKFPTKEDGGGPNVLRAPTSFLGRLNMHPLISKALEEESLRKEDYDEQNDSVADLEDLRVEIEAMGGDPWFLPDIQREEPLINSKQEARLKLGGNDNYNQQNDSVANIEDQRAEIEGIGGDPSFLPSILREPLINSKQAERLKAGGHDNYNQQNDSVPDLEDLRAEIEAMGGDLWFLPSQQRDPMINSKQEECLKVGGDDSCNEQNDSVANLESLQSEEIEAMGGDPWFLPSIQREPSINSKQAERFKVGGNDKYTEQNDSLADLEDLRSEIEAMGGDPWFLPNIQRESLINSKQEAQLKVGGDDNCNEQTDSVANLESLQAEEIEAMGGDPWFLPSQQRDPRINKRLKEEGLSEEDELLEIGGDPAFLGNYKEQNDPNRDLELLLAEIEEMGGDPSFL